MLLGKSLCNLCLKKETLQKVNIYRSREMLVTGRSSESISVMHLVSDFVDILSWKL